MAKIKIFSYPFSTSMNPKLSNPVVEKRIFLTVFKDIYKVTYKHDNSFSF